jgi:hypothetical protein
MVDYLLKYVILFLFTCFNLFVVKQNMFLHILFSVFFIYSVCIKPHLFKTFSIIKINN